MTDQIDNNVDDEIDEPLTLREEIENAVTEVKEREVTDPDNKETPVDTKNKVRDDNGKFAKKEIGETPVTPETPVKANIPDAWNNDARKDKFNALPPELQAEIAKREDEVRKGFTKLDEERNFGKQLKEVITPYMPMIQAEGGNPMGAVQALLNSAYQLRNGSPQQKVELVKQIARQYGVDMSQINSPAQYVDPQVQSLQQRLEATENHIRTEAQQRQYQQQSAVTSEIDAFAANPANVHFESVKAHMAALLQNGLAQDLTDAYEQAVYARPDIRSTILAQQNADAEAKRLEEIKTRTNAARRASVSVTGAPGGAVPNRAASELSLRDELTKSFREHLN